MKKILIVLAFLLILVGCGESEGSNINNTTNISETKEENETEEEDTERFVIVKASTHYTIIADKETKVMYVHYYHGGITYMVDENGRPLLWED